MNIGDVLNRRFRLERRFSCDTSTLVYAATDCDTSRPCIVKARADRDNNAAEVELEARTLATIDHPNIPRLITRFVVEDDRDNGRRYHCLVREYVDGVTLRQAVMDGRRFSEQEVLRFAAAIVDMLDTLHRMNPPVIHRDLRPQNLIVDTNDQLHIIDFDSVTESATAIPASIEASTAISTFGYSPLEQYAGDSSPASDIYTLGVTLVYLLTRVEPWEMADVEGRLDFSQRLNVSTPTLNVLKRMTEPERSARYPSAAAVKTDLEPALHGYTPSTVRSSSAVVLASVLAAPVAVAVVVVTVIIVVLILVL